MEAPPPFRDDRITNPKQRAFLAAFAVIGNVTGAAIAAGIHRRSHGNWLRHPEYAEAFEDARQHSADHLEEVARARAVQGSDVLLIFLLKGLRPEIYRERFEHSGPRGGPVAPSAVVHVSYDYNMNPPETKFEARRRLEAEATKLLGTGDRGEMRAPVCAISKRASKT